MKRNYHSNSTFLDLLFNMLLGFVALFFISFLMINPVSKKNKDVESKAEFIITLTWDKDSVDDLDVYLEDPLGEVLYYQAREIGVMHLDRDDLGGSNDEVTLKDGSKIIVSDNREIVTLRGVIPGEYILNIHVYAKNDSEPVNAKVVIDKINPFNAILSEEFTFTHYGEEKTVCRFNLNSKGEVVSMNKIPKVIVGNDDNEFNDENDFHDNPRYSPNRYDER